jgi:hypothetical protein
MKILPKVKLLVLAAAVFSVPAFASTGSNSGTIAAFKVIASAGGAPGSQDFRVSLSGLSTLCPGQATAYVNTTDANYLAIWRNLISAREHGSTVTIAWQTDASGFCQITSILY